MDLPLHHECIFRTLIIKHGGMGLMVIMMVVLVVVWVGVVVLVVMVVVGYGVCL